MLGPAGSRNQPHGTQEPLDRRDAVTSVAEVARAVPLKGPGEGSNGFWRPLWSPQGCSRLPPAQLRKEAMPPANSPEKPGGSGNGREHGGRLRLRTDRPPPGTECAHTSSQVKPHS